MNKQERNTKPMEPDLAQKVLSRLTFHFCKESNKRTAEDTNVILQALNTGISALEKQMSKKNNVDQITTETAEYTCDNLCRHPRRVKDKDMLEEICCECKLGQFICDILNECEEVSHG